MLEALVRSFQYARLIVVMWLTKALVLAVTVNQLQLRLQLLKWILCMYQRRFDGIHSMTLVQDFQVEHAAGYSNKNVAVQILLMDCLRWKRE